MAIKIRFESNQQYQRDAIDSVVKLFAGQEADRSAVILSGESDAGALPGATPGGGSSSSTRPSSVTD